MKQIYHPYWKWEDYKNGMYDLNMENSEEKVTLAKYLLCHLNEFHKTIELVIENWPIATSENLTNISCNRRAWLGQASCCYKYKVPEILTRIAWKELTEEERINANKVADLCIKKYESILRHGNKNVTVMGYQMTFQFD